MALGAVWCSAEKTRETAARLREIKLKHALPASFETKWTKVSPAKLSYYLEVIDYFFDNDDLHFRALVIPDKSQLNHAAFEGQTHDTWYYKMYFDLIKVLLVPTNKYRIYIDVKDTLGVEKVAKLHDVLCNNLYDFSREIVERVQQVRSNEVEQLQLTDLLLGSVSYVNRGLRTSDAKQAIVGRVKERSGYNLDKTTLLREEKVNIFRWNAQQSQ